MHGASLVFALTLTNIILCGQVSAQGCPEGELRSRLFSHVDVLCDGDSGGSQITTESNVVRYNSSRVGDRHITVLPPLTAIPVDLSLVVASAKGNLRQKSSIAVVKKLGDEPVVYDFAKSSDKLLFKAYFNLLLTLVQAHEYGLCPVDTSGSEYPELAGLYERLQILAVVFRVKDCGLSIEAT